MLWRRCGEEAEEACPMGDLIHRVQGLGLLPLRHRAFRLDSCFEAGPLGMPSSSKTAREGPS